MLYGPMPWITSVNWVHPSSRTSWPLRLPRSWTAYSTEPELVPRCRQGCRISEKERFRPWSRPASIASSSDSPLATTPEDQQHRLFLNAGHALWAVRVLLLLHIRSRNDGAFEPDIKERFLLDAQSEGLIHTLNSVINELLDDANKDDVPRKRQRI
ncbi:hypothetical protein CF319_g6584 [Tilletia indica]|nr:hypothetical protein CF319_g6584 [Tilletia indica]